MNTNKYRAKIQKKLQLYIIKYAHNHVKNELTALFLSIIDRYLLFS